MENSYKKSLVSASTTLQDNVNNSSMDLPGIGTPVNVPLTRQISKREDSPPESESHTRSVTPVQHHINPKALEAGFSKGKEQEIILVEWNGPDDPCNPLKYVLPVYSSRKFIINF